MKVWDRVSFLRTNGIKRTEAKSMLGHALRRMEVESKSLYEALALESRLRLKINRNNIRNTLKCYHFN